MPSDYEENKSFVSKDGQMLSFYSIGNTRNTFDYFETAAPGVILEQKVAGPVATAAKNKQ